MIQRLPPTLIALRTEQTVVAGWRNPALQRISDTLRSGLTWYTSGTLPLDKAAKLVAKLQSAFPELARNRNFASRLKAKGLPRYKLIMFANRPGDTALFWLFTDQPIDPRERWLDATSCESRLTCYQWEAVRRTKKGVSTPVWTWAMTAEALLAAKKELRTVIRKGPVERAVAIGRESATWPGFSAVRRQRLALAYLYAGEWRRFRKGEPPVWPRLRFVQRLKTR